MRTMDVFKPNNYPEHSYVDRTEYRLEQLLRDSIDMGNVVISVSGPSKTGKTVLLKRVIESDLFIDITGASIGRPEEVWEHVLEWMNVPKTVSLTTSTTSGDSTGGGVSAKIGLPGIGSIGAKAQSTEVSSKAESQTTTRYLNAFEQVVREIGGSDYIIFIDDFHYIDKNLQSEVARQIKAISERGVKVCTASVPHRSDDVVRSNPELRGRLAAINSTYWSINELKEIAHKGCKCLNVGLDSGYVDRLAKESFGSPQLMQALCLNLLLELDHREKSKSIKYEKYDSRIFLRTLERTSILADYSTLTEALHSGPKQRGTERKQFNFTDGSSGDVYRCVLLALSSNPANLTQRYEDLLNRVREICKDDNPVGSSIAEAVRQMQKISNMLSPQTDVVAWDEDILNILEPYFLFYLRSSTKLRDLSVARS